MLNLPTDYMIFSLHFLPRCCTIVVGATVVVVVVVVLVVDQKGLVSLCMTFAMLLEYLLYGILNYAILE